MRPSLLLAAGALALMGCADDGEDMPFGSSTTDPTSEPATAPPGEDATSSVGSQVAALFASFGSTLVELVDAAGAVVQLCLIDADTDRERSRGLMEVTDLSASEGMLFTNSEERTGAFFMFQTRIPLTVGWWDDDGAYVGEADMTPCESDNSGECRLYPAPGPFRYGIEVGIDDPLGDRFAGSSIDVLGGSCHTQ